MKSSQELAKDIRKSNEWDLDLLAELCKMAGLSEEWDQSDGETFEDVAFKAAEILQVNIL